MKAFTYTTIALVAFLVGIFSAQVSKGPSASLFLNSCNVGVVPLRGVLYAYGGDPITSGGQETSQDSIAYSSSEMIVNAIHEADNDATKSAILIDIDSPGGLPVAAEEIASALRSAKKPTAALIHTQGDSAAYWAATGAQQIFASSLSEVGGIAVTSSYLDQSIKDEKDGFTYNQISSGKYKDMYNSGRAMTPEEHDLAMRDVNAIHDIFVKAVAKHRNLPEGMIRSYADGSSMLGDLALERGLVDQIGGWNEVQKYLESRIGGPVRFCK
jgi:protease-4